MSLHAFNLKYVHVFYMYTLQIQSHVGYARRQKKGGTDTKYLDLDVAWGIGERPQEDNRFLS